ncbi:hypothetical protein TNCV_5103061 [Trichonephila clavipes]|nr:hypothetical protein TNCV_5103061 [Trichonephila clavipes]
MLAKSLEQIKWHEWSETASRSPMRTQSPPFTWMGDTSRSRDPGFIHQDHVISRDRMCLHRSIYTRTTRILYILKRKNRVILFAQDATSLKGG